MARKRTARDEDISRRTAIEKKLLKLFGAVEKGFEDQRERADEILDYWDAYNCVLGPRQFYNGQSKLYVPIVKVAVDARKTRFVNQMFPQTGRYVEVTGTEDDLPLETVALLEHYIRDARLRTQVMPALCVAGDVEGHYNAYIHWDKIERHVVSREKRPVQIQGVDMPEAGEQDDIVEDTIEDAGPALEVLPDADVLVLPATVDNTTQALQRGGSLTVVRRWSKETIRQMIDDGDIREDAGDRLLAAMGRRAIDQGADIAARILERLVPQFFPDLRRRSNLPLIGLERQQLLQLLDVKLRCLPNLRCRILRRDASEIGLLLGNQRRLRRTLGQRLGLV